VRRLARNEEGFTLIEVLISAAVFMIGFSILIAVLSTSLGKISTKETNLASCIAREYMTISCISEPLHSSDTTVCRSEICLDLKRIVTDKEGLVGIRVMVNRQVTGKNLVDLYCELAKSKE